MVGSESYTAPETYSSIQYDGKSSDVWSLGIILCYLINKKQPWKLAMWSNSDYQQFINQDNFLQEPYFVDFPVESLLLTSQILEQDPLRRIKINDFLEINGLVLFSIVVVVLLVVVLTTKLVGLIMGNLSESKLSLSWGKKILETVTISF